MPKCGCYGNFQGPKSRQGMTEQFMNLSAWKSKSSVEYSEKTLSAASRLSMSMG